MKKSKKNNENTKYYILITTVFLALIFCLSPLPTEANQNIIQIHGFGGWGYGHTDGNYHNVLLNPDEITKYLIRRAQFNS